jgi:hypothetical protein
MMEETVAFLQYLLGLIFGILVGIAFGGLWALVGPTVVRHPFLSHYDSGGMFSHIDRALISEVDFAASCPGQDYAIHWWGWSPVDVPDSTIMSTTEPPPKSGDPIAQLGQKFANMKGTFTTRLEPWLRLVWIRGVAVLSILVAAVLPTFAMWLDGRRRAYALLATGKMPSTGLWKIWGGITTLLALFTGFLIGAPFPYGMAPWLLVVLIGALFALCQVRAAKNARLS